MALGTELEDPLARLKRIHEAGMDSKAYLRAIGAKALTDWSSHVPARLAALGFRAASASGLLEATRPVFTTVVMNVPGVQKPLYMAGARLIRVYAAGPCLDGVGLFHAATSYEGRMSIAFQCCRDMMPDPAFYEACLEKSFRELREAAQGVHREPHAGRTRRKRTART